jgi:hypothetical protein
MGDGLSVIGDLGLVGKSLQVQPLMQDPVAGALAGNTACENKEKKEQ